VAIYSPADKIFLNVKADQMKAPRAAAARGARSLVFAQQVIGLSAVGTVVVRIEGRWYEHFCLLVDLIVAGRRELERTVDRCLSRRLFVAAFSFCRRHQWQRYRGGDRDNSKRALNLEHVSLHPLFVARSHFSRSVNVVAASAGETGRGGVLFRPPEDFLMWSGRWISRVFFWLMIAFCRRAGGAEILNCGGDGLRGKGAPLRRRQLQFFVSVDDRSGF